MKFRKKPVVVEAILFTEDNADAVQAFIGADGDVHNGPSYAKIRTWEGELIAVPGEWIIRGVEGEFYPCKPSIFDATYEPVEARDE